MVRSRFLPAVAASAAIVTFFAAAALAQAASEGFKGEQVTMIVGSATGGGYDIQGRLIAQYMGRHLPGNPGIVVQNMPGGGGLVSANYLYNEAPKNGATFGLLQREMLTAKLNNPQNVRFDIGKFNWIGNIDSETGIVVAWHSSPIMTTDDLFKKEMIIGGTGPLIDTETLPRLLNALIGTKFRIVSGYPGLSDVTLAMENGEVMGIGDWSWSNIKSRNADMLADKKIRLLMQASLGRVKDLPNVPSMLDFAKNGDDRQLMEVFLAQEAVARPIAAPPGAPAARVKMLRAAFMAAIHDPEFLREVARSRLDIVPSSGEEIDRVIALIGKTPKSVTDRLVTAIAPPK